MKVLDFPLVKITISFILGILVCYFWQPSILLATTALGLGIFLISILYFLSKKSKKANILFGISINYLSFCVGITTLLINTDSLQQSNYTHYEKAFKSEHYVTLTLREKIKSNDYSDRYIAIVNSINQKKYSGRIIINVQKDSLPNLLIIGNKIKVKTILHHNSPSKNPNQFDYSKYLANKQIYAQIYTSKAAININKKIKKDIWFYASRLNTRIIRNLEKANFNKVEMDVAMALILGQQQEISADIIKDYQYSGATHVLSVSGLHVGFIMIFILFILKPIPNTKKGSFTKLVVIIISLALFGIVSGLSPPVLRSVVMFSFIAIGNHLHRSTNTYHTLLVSVLLILLFEPYFLFDVGFQLSYIALFSIVWIQPLFKNIWTPKNKIINYLWEALTVSFAAQIGTFPICLYYFHQFPGLFFVTNILILPVLSFIMIAGIIVMVISVFQSCPLFIVQIFEKSIYFLNLIIHYVASFDSFVIINICFNSYYLFTFSLVTITVIIWFKKPSFGKLIAFLFTLILLQISFVYTKKETENQRELIVFNTAKKTIITKRTGQNVSIFTNDSLLKKETKNNITDAYLVGNFATLKEIKTVRNLLFFNGKKILLIDSTGIYEDKIQPDIIILTQSPRINLDRILQKLKPKIVVADATNSNSMQKYWRTSCLIKNIPFHATREKGYYTLN
ncbi:ComEC/Rec2 family competence protein [Flavobacterium pectinovorum]|uniref:Competence protein ComEC n=1 Tax=Flavobacterium pectinovorum TaxID=29533 RepID=A0AB36P250_9FLAO|nr:ComEC/Rec2 family competence protein [Flavobacterium pectinovorum]OXB05808.1 competence protein ComEC [Flavobacterium pectinovorum]SHM12236.1 competence protein ComEC [Flavobacterium pectinovorum]